MAFPAIIVAIIEWHLNCFAEPGEDARVFTSPTGRPLRHSNFRRGVWLPALKLADLAGIHFHDLRHTGTPWRPAPGLLFVS